MLLLTIILFSLLFSTMIVHADSSKNQKYIVVNKRNDTLSIIEIPYKLNDWEFGFDAKKGITGDIWLPTYYFYSGEDPLLTQVYENANYGDVIEYCGETMIRTETNAWNQMRRLANQNGEYASNETFNTVGNVLINEEFSEYKAVVNGQSVITMTSVEGTRYFALPGCMDPIVPFIHESELQEIGDVDKSNMVDASDAACVLIASASIGAGKQFDLNEVQRWSADVNHDGIVNASDAAIILIYAAEHGAGTFSGSFEEYVNR